MLDFNCVVSVLMTPAHPLARSSPVGARYWGGGWELGGKKKKKRKEN